MKMEEKTSDNDFAPNVASEKFADNKLAPNVASEKFADNKLSKRARKRLLTKERERKKKEAKRSQHKEDSMSNNSDVLQENQMRETEYYFEKGLRKVYPYYYEFAAHCKGRWAGRTLMDVFTSEFKYTAIPLTESLESGLITVNGNKTSADYKLKNHDYIRNRIHRHELPVLGQEIEVIADTEQVLVVNKPSSIPIHPCGRYHYNTLTYILAEEKGYRNLRSIYRLDRLTSGVMIFCKVEGTARSMIEHIQQRKVQKEYICRVEGEFPNGIIECKEPLEVFSPKVGLQKVTENGKSAYTSFERMSYNGHSSVVKCMPHTGRTHQLRVHLQFLGYPILNDPLYNHDGWGPHRGKGGQFEKSDQQLLEDLLKVHTDDLYLVQPDGNSSEKCHDQSDMDKPTETTCNEKCGEASGYKDHNTEGEQCSESLTHTPDTLVCDSVTGANKRTSDSEIERECKVQKCDNGAKEKMFTQLTDTGSDTKETINKDTIEIEPESASGSSQPDKIHVNTTAKRPAFDQSKITFDKSCVTCQQTYRDPLPKELVMFLHAYSYEGPGWKYTTSFPEWAQENWAEDSTT